MVTPDHQPRGPIPGIDDKDTRYHATREVNDRTLSTPSTIRSSLHSRRRAGSLFGTEMGVRLPPK